MTTNNANTINNVSTLINAVMRDATTEGNRQGELVVALFSNEVSYSVDVIVNAFNKKGVEKTEAIDKMLADASDEFQGVIEQLAYLKAVKEKDRKQNHAFQVEALTRKARAARIMFERALCGVYFLRIGNCKRVETIKVGTGALKAVMPDLSEGAGEGEYVNEKFSCTTITQQGKKLLDTVTGKAKPATTARNPVANVLADASKSLGATLTSLASEGKRKAMTDFDDSVEANLEVTLRELFAMKFADDKGRIELSDVSAWIAETFGKIKREDVSKKAA